MKTKKKKLKTSKRKIQNFIISSIFIILIAVLSYNLIQNLQSIKEMKSEKKALYNKISELKDKQEELKVDILKLEDPDYIAKYVREKYYYSKDGELILRIDD